MNPKMIELFRRLVVHFGGQDKTALALQVNQSTVSGWTRGKHAMSAETAILAQHKTNGLFVASQLRPSLSDLAPTLNETIRPASAIGQSADGAGVSSSIPKASP